MSKFVIVPKGMDASIAVSMGSKKHDTREEAEKVLGDIAAKTGAHPDGTSGRAVVDEFFEIKEV
jgi:hypothetical protein